MQVTAVASPMQPSLHKSAMSNTGVAGAEHALRHPAVLTAVQVCQVRLTDGHIFRCSVLVQLLVPLLKEGLIMTLQHTTHTCAASALQRFDKL